MTTEISRATRLALVAAIAAATLLATNMRVLRVAAQSSGLIAGYSFDAGSGSTVADSSGNGLTGTIVGATWTTAGRYGGALTFNGSSNYVDLGAPAQLQLTGSLTLEAWVKASANPADDGQIIAKSNGFGWQLKTSPDTGPHTFAFGVSPSATLLTQRYSTTARSLNTWYHVAGVFDAIASTMTMYVNGVAEAGVLRGSIPVSQFNQAVNVNIGRRTGGYYFSGVIDEVRVYGRALSGAEIQADMTTPIGSAPPPPDTTPPSVGITTPAPGATIIGIANVTASASDNVGVAGVRLMVDGTDIAPEITSAPFSLQWDTSTVPVGAHTLTAVARDVAGNTALSADVTVNISRPSPNSVGQWSAVASWPIVAVHASLLPSGKVLAWTDYTINSGAQLWDPSTNRFTPKDNSFTSLFCAAHSFLADGRLLVAGGIVGLQDDIGPRDTNFFDPASETWSQGGLMRTGRYYPTTATLGDGRVIVIGGTTTCTSCVALTPEIYDPATDTWTEMANSARRSFRYYPHVYQLPDGRVLVAAQDDQAISSSVLDFNTQKWSTVDSRVIDGHSSVMYWPGKILKAGTATADNPGFTSASTSFTLDMAQPSPTWQSAGNMAFPRSYVNLTVLPDGQVLATGGGTTTDPANFSNAVYEAELWSPISRTWTTLARSQVPRLYHSTAVLMPDARVLIAGGGRQNGRSQPDPADQLNAEIFSPPYLFKGPRPVITAAPNVLPYNNAFTIATPDTARIGAVSLIALTAVTHSFNENQRYVPLTFSVSGSSLNVTGPINGNTAPPGPYMLFIVDTNGVPSTAAMVRLPGPGEDTQPPTAPTNLSASAGTGAVALTWSAATDNVAVTGYNVHRSTSSGFTPSPANKIGQTSATSFTDSGFGSGGAYYYLVTAQDAKTNVSAPSNETSATVVLDTTPPAVTVTVPTTGTTLSGTVSMSATASDDVGVAGVQFLLDGAPIGNEVLGSGPTFTLNWISNTALNGSHILAARARDKGGNTAVSGGVTVTVANTVPSDLVAAYAFDEGSGTTVTDLSGNNLTGTIVGATWTTTGRYGSTLSFNGTTSYVDLGNPTALQLTGSMTVEAWVRASANPPDDGQIVAKSNGAGWEFKTSPDTGPHTFAVGVSGSSTSVTQRYSTTTRSLNTWYHVAGVYDAATGTLNTYVNGVLDNGTLRNTVPATQFNAAVNVNIGRRTGGFYFSGMIDEVRIYKRALTAAEVAADATTPVGPHLVITQPAAGSTVTGGTVDVLYGAVGILTNVNHVHFKLDSNPEVMDVDFDGRYQFANVPAGSHTLTGYLVRADHSKIPGTDASVNFSTVIPDNTGPTVSITAPAAGTTVTGNRTLTASASDDVAMAGVQFLIDGATVGAEVTGAGPTYTMTWDSRTVSNGTHVVAAVARDSSNNKTASSGVSITVLNDTVGPAVAMTSPAGGATVSGSLLLTAAASDDVGMAGVQFLLDGANLGAEVIGTGPSYGFALDTTTVSNGSHRLAARARDTSNNSTVSAEVVVTVSNVDSVPPTASITSPGSGSTLTGTVNVTATASDNVGIATAQFLLDNTNLGPLQNGPGPQFALSWDTKTVVNGPHVLSIRVSDAAGNIATAAGVSITISNDTTPPTVSITGPAAGATVSATVAVAASATDDVAIAGVQFLLDGSPLGTEVTGAGPTYSMNWNTTTTGNGGHLLSARARDAAGNTATSPSVSVTVSNTAPSGVLVSYAFNEGTGTTTRDGSGNNVTGTLSGATWTTAGKNGNALSFNGTTAYVNLGNPTVLQGTGSMTWATWVKATATPADDGQIVSRANDTTGWQLKTSPDTGPHTFAIQVGNTSGGNAQRYSNTVRSLNVWYHVAGVYNATTRTLDIYVNGVLDNGVLRGTVPAAQSPANVNVNIGRRTGGFNFAGVIDDMRIYNRALSAAEIQAIMNTPLQ